MVGSSGFVGTSVVNSLRSCGHEVVCVKAPRLFWDFGVDENVLALARIEAQYFLKNMLFRGVDVVVNAAGVPTARADRASLFGANALLPLVIALAAEQSGCQRFIHISSAAVLGSGLLHDEAPMFPISVYGQSKAKGELLLSSLSPLPTVCYRPTSVQGPNRDVTLALMRYSQSPYAACASPGDDPSPQVHVINVGRACEYLASTGQNIPRVVVHPWEGWTTSTFLTSLAGQVPKLLPRHVARAMSSTSRLMTSRMPRVSFYSRRIEMLLFGQSHKDGWLAQQSINWLHTANSWDGRGGVWGEMH